MTLFLTRENSKSSGQPIREITESCAKQCGIFLTESQTLSEMELGGGGKGGGGRRRRGDGNQAREREG